MILLTAALELWTILTGLFVIIFILARNKLRTNSSNWLIINTLFVCLLNAVFIDPILIDIHQLDMQNLPWRFGSLYCYMLFGGPSDVLTSLIPLTLMMVIIDRLMYIRSSNRKEQHLSLGAILAMIVSPWVLLTLITVVMVYVFRPPTFLSDKNQCTLPAGNSSWVVAPYATWLTLSLGLPLLFMNVAAILSIASACCTTIKTNAGDAISEKKEKKSVKQASLMITCLTVFFTVVAVPSAVAYITRYSATMPAISFEVVIILQMAFQAIQPLLFVSLVPDIRAAAYDMFCGWRDDSRRRDEQTRLIKVTSSPARTPE